MTFETAVDFVLDREGGYIIDPHDPGGETKYGISKRAYPLEDVPNLTRERAVYLYERDYWRACKCAELPPALALLVFDTAVNQGPDVAIRLLQRTLMIHEDGIVGPETIRAAQTRNIHLVLRDYARRRILRYARSVNADAFLGGWIGRTLIAFETALKEIKP